MKPKHLFEIGIPHGKCIEVAIEVLRVAAKMHLDDREVQPKLRQLVADPASFANHNLYGPLAKAVIEHRAAGGTFRAREAPAPYKIWGGENLEAGALQQMANAAQLPVAACGALMADAHQGYGLPIGGVLATRNAVIPYAVGVDIACRMKLTVLDLPASELLDHEDRLTKAIEAETRFGVGAIFRDRRDHEVLEADWNASPVTKTNRDKAWSQLGTSGSGNHFVEFGTLTLPQADLGLAEGTYLALLSHSGSRGTGATVASHYSKLAMDKHPELPRELRHLAWLDLDSDEGREYWAAMELMGRYAAANHALIHKHVAEHLGAQVLLDVENHHNFAWKENHGGEDVIVHRKGATPAGAGVIGVIPGSMADPGFIVRGKGVAESLNSASHGAGRRMSRTAAFQKFTWDDAKKYLSERGVKLISAGLDEAPMAYKNIREVMAAQEDLVEIVARFDPRLVKMAPAGERPED